MCATILLVDKIEDYVSSLIQTIYDVIRCQKCSSCLKFKARFCHADNRSHLEHKLTLTQTCKSVLAWLPVKLLIGWQTYGPP